MGKLARAILLAIATVAAALVPAYGQSRVPTIPPPTTIINRGTPITPLGWFVIGSVGCAAVSPMIATVILGRELTLNEAYRSTLGCFLGPIGWLLADALVPPTVTTQIQTQTRLPNRRLGSSARGVDAISRYRRRGNTICGQRTRPRVCAQCHGADAQYAREHSAIDRTGNAEIRIDRPHAQPLAYRWPAVSAGNARSGRPQLSWRVGRLGQHGLCRRADAGTGSSTAGGGRTSAQYVVDKLHLLEAHRITSGDDVLVAVIDSKIDTKHPDLTGVVADEYDVVGSPAVAHSTALPWPEQLPRGAS